MRNPTKNRRGTTLVELIVCMGLLGIFSVAVVALIQPCSKAFSEMQQLTRAQNLADSTIERLRGELLQATDFVRITNGAAVGHEGDIFKMEQPVEGTVNPTQGSAIEFGLESDYIELIDAGSIAATDLTAPKTTDIEKDAVVPGYVHLRYFKTEGYEKENISDPDYVGYTLQPQHRDDVDKEIAYNYTEAFPKNSYMNMTLELQFTVRGHTPTSVPYKTENATASRVNSMTVLVAVKDAKGDVICTQKSILSLPHQPILVQKGP